MNQFAYLLNAVVGADITPMEICEVRNSHEIRFRYAGDTYVVRLVNDIAYVDKTEGSCMLTSAPKSITEAIRLSHYKELAKRVPKE